MMSTAGRLGDTENAGDGGRHDGGVAYDRQVDEEDAVSEVLQQIGGKLQAEACLARAAGAGQGEQAHVGPAQQGQAVGHLLVATDEGGQSGWAGRAGASRGDRGVETGRQAGRDDLEDALRRGAGP